MKKSDERIARASVFIDAPVDKVWDALINPVLIKKYMFGSTVTSDWKKGSSITWKGEWEGKAFEDKGKVLNVVPEEKLQYTHASAAGGEKSEHTITITLAYENDGVFLTLEQDNNPTKEAREHSQKNWMTMLEGMKRVLEEK